MDNQADHTMTLRLPKTLHEQAKQRARLEDRSVSQLLRVALRTYLVGDGARTPDELASA